MHPSIERAYQERTHPLINHPIHGVYGQDLARAAYEHIRDKYAEMVGHERFDMRGDMRLLALAQRLEYQHREELEEVAVQIVKEVWGIKDEINFVAKLNPQPEFELQLQRPQRMSPGHFEFEEGEEEEITPDEKKEIDKRITMNIMVHGAALHQMSTMHHMASDVINRIDNRLLSAYDRVARGSQYSAWFMDLDMILGQMGIQGGEVKVKWVEDEDEGKEWEPEEEEEGEIDLSKEEEFKQAESKPTVYATAIVFPMLLHELTKGVMEVLTAHGLPKDEELLKKVYKHADKPEHEFFHYLVGPEIWRRFINVVSKVVSGKGKLGKYSLPDVIATLSTQSPDEIHKIIGAVVDDPDRAGELVAGLMSYEAESMGDEEPEEPEGEKFMECKKCRKPMNECKCNGDINRIADSITDDPDIVMEGPAAPAPTAPPKKAPEKTPTPSRPTPKKVPSPFNPPKPAVDPGPKAKKEEE